MPSHRPRWLLPEAQQRHEPHSLGGDPPGHLALALLAVFEDDRHLDDAKAGPRRTVGELDLEGVALRADAVEVDLFEHLAEEALAAAGQVAHAQAEDPARVGGAALGDEAA